MGPINSFNFHFCVRFGISRVVSVGWFQLRVRSCEEYPGESHEKAGPIIEAAQTAQSDHAKGGPRHDVGHPLGLRSERGGVLDASLQRPSTRPGCHARTEPVFAPCSQRTPAPTPEAVSSENNSGKPTRRHPLRKTTDPLRGGRRFNPKRHQESWATAWGKTTRRRGSRGRRL